MNGKMVSVIIPVYNGGKYMREAIDSALGQTYGNIEVIVVNDGSEDGGETRRIALSYGDRIRYFEKENGGVSSALNYGIQVMRGEYFSWLSHDDVYTPDKISAQMAAMAAFPEGDTLIYCRCASIDCNSQPIKRKSRSDALPTDRVIYHEEILKHLLTRGSLNGCCLLIPKRVFSDCGLFCEELRYAQDSLMWYTVFSRGLRLYALPDTCVKSRIHIEQQSNILHALYRSDCKRICDIILPIFSKLSTESTDFVYLLARKNALRGNKEAFLTCRGRMKNGKHLRLFALRLYGTIRPALVRAYRFLLTKERGQR